MSVSGNVLNVVGDDTGIKKATLCSVLFNHLLPFEIYSSTSCCDLEQNHIILYYNNYNYTLRMIICIIIHMLMLCCCWV